MKFTRLIYVCIGLILSLSIQTFAQEATEPALPPTVMITETPFSTETATATATNLPTATETATATEAPTSTETATVVLPTEPEITQELIPEVTVETTQEIGTATEAATSVATEIIPVDASLTPTETSTEQPQPFPIVGRTDVIPPDNLTVLRHTDFPDFTGWQVNAAWENVQIGDVQAIALGGGADPLVFTDANLMNSVISVRVLMQNEPVQIQVRKSAEGVYTAILEPSGVVSLWRDAEQLTAQYIGSIQAGAWYTFSVTTYYDMFHVTVNGAIVLAISDPEGLREGQIVVGTGRNPESRLTVDAALVQVRAVAQNQLMGMQAQSNVMLEQMGVSISTVEALQSAIANCTNGASLVIDLEPIVYTLTTYITTASGPSGIYVDNCNLTINGNGATIQRPSTAQPFRIFTIVATAPLQIEFNNFTITGGDARPNYSGGAISLADRNNLRLSAMTLSNNQARSSGAINANGVSLLTIENMSVIANNTADQLSGGAYISLNQYSDNLIISHTEFRNNRAIASLGGGLLVQGIGNVDIFGSTFTSNSASLTGGGGAIIIAPSMNATVRYSEFRNNINKAVMVNTLTTMTNNCFSGNTGGIGQYDVYTYNNDINNNWWGQSTGYSTNPNQTNILETISFQISPNPLPNFLTAPPAEGCGITTTATNGTTPTPTPPPTCSGVQQLRVGGMQILNQQDGCPVTDLAVTISTTHTVIRPRNEALLEITLLNNTNGQATQNIGVEYIIPTEMEFVSASDTESVIYDEQSRLLTWTIPDIQAGENSQLSITIRVQDVDADTSVQNQVEVPYGNDTDPSNNTSSTQTRILETCFAGLPSDGAFNTYNNPNTNNRVATVNTMNMRPEGIEVLGLHRNSDGELWYYLGEYRQSLAEDWVIAESAIVLETSISCQNLELLNQSGSPVPLIPKDDAGIDVDILDNCLFMMPVANVAVFSSIDDITTVTNGGAVDPNTITGLVEGHPVYVKALHPNRQYLEINFNLEEPVGSGNYVAHSGWMKRFSGTLGSNGTNYISGTSPCLQTLTLDPNRLPVCGTDQIFNCRPSPSCPWIFGCNNGVQVPHYTLHPWASTGPGCDNADDDYCVPDPCPLWDANDDRHCGTDSITQADYNGNPNIRDVFVIEGGIFHGYDGISGTYLIRVASGSEIHEYQYTHVRRTESIASRQSIGEYIHSDIELGAYALIGLTDREHVHTVIVRYDQPPAPTINLRENGNGIDYQPFPIPEIAIP